MLHFVQESSEIEDVSIPERDCLEAWQHGTGHMGAARQTLEIAERRQPASIEHLCAWQAAITREQLPYGHWIAQHHIGCLRTQRMRMGKRQFAPPEDIVPQLTRILNEVSSVGSEGALEVAAETHWRYELLHPFADGNGRTGRLLALYTLRSAGLPPVLFTAGDRDACYFRAFDPATPQPMIAYFREHQLTTDPWQREEPEQGE
ncbi:MAG TPA: Fic family protein [Chloroflexota bacterium]